MLDDECDPDFPREKLFGLSRHTGKGYKICDPENLWRIMMGKFYL
jgi:hypothetical protein